MEHAGNTSDSICVRSRNAVTLSNNVCFSSELWTEPVSAEKLFIKDLHEDAESQRNKHLCSEKLKELHVPPSV